ncbi:MAG: hypothetical protein EPO51_23045 [Phenylobacterium sp.]|uniref:alginate O-acetyltransferase AlgX-related protein n=1 Tax=Phenylobacterium sp. TaxID=1871053 RepID=UPI00120E1182|nr:hypothetical protein [Phenylobacterium sp.]TAJ69388.1 MAG: hypothetical protein EPO51_23045 [Phenylobacterium sp.]
MADIRRGHWGRLIGAAVAVIAGAFVAPRIMGRPDIQENRVLAAPPEPPRSAADLTAFRKATDAWVADHFPPRIQLIGALNALRMQFGVSGSSRVIVGRDGWLFHDDSTHLGAGRGDPPLADAAAQAWLEGLAGRTEALRAEGRAYVVLAPPLKETVYPEFAPGWFHLDPNRTAVRLSRLARLSGAGDVVYPYAEIARQARWGLKTYSRHDTHWTDLGAYHGYAAFMRNLQARGLAEGPRGLEDFSPLTAPGEGGSPRDLARMLGVASFVKVDYPMVEETVPPQNLRITYLSPKLDWTGPRLIETGQVGKPTLLMTVDSFSNALLPFLYAHFSRIVTAHNQDGVWRPDLIARFQPDIVALEVVEGSLPIVMAGGPPAPPEAQARIRQNIANRKSYLIYPSTGPRPRKGKLIEGGPGDDLLEGTPRSDVIQGRPGDDTLNGGAGNDTLPAGQGRDVVYGGDGDDFIAGGRDDDVLHGGKGGDTFSFAVGSGVDQIMDFNAGEGDRIQVTRGTGYAARQVGADTVVEFQGARLILRGVAMADLPRGWIANR